MGEEPRGQWRGSGPQVACSLSPRATLIRYSASLSLSGDSGIDFIACSSRDNGDFVVSFSIGVRQCPSFPFFAFFHVRKSEGFMHVNLRRFRDGPDIYLAITT